MDALAVMNDSGGPQQTADTDVHLNNAQRTLKHVDVRDILSCLPFCRRTLQLLMLIFPSVRETYRISSSQVQRRDQREADQKQVRTPTQTQTHTLNA